MKNKGHLSSIGIVVCYIGKLPEWFPLWVKSCAYNSTIDFLLYTDQDLKEMPNNIIVRKTTLSCLQRRFSETLGFDCSLETAYKLCDYKVIYGNAFKEDLFKYEFWGHCDIDMIFGNLRNFLSENILDSNDRIFEVGHLCLYRNCEKINRLYSERGSLFSYFQVFREKHYCGFDEHTGITRICEINRIKTYKNVVCADIDPHYRAFYMMDEDSVNGKMMLKNYRYQVFTWENGRTWQNYLDKFGEVKKKEVSYIHFMRKYPQNAERCIRNRAYCITYKEFIPLKVSITKQNILQYSFTRNEIETKIEYVRSFVKNGIRAFTRGEFVLRVKLRINRIKRINACKVKL